VSTTKPFAGQDGLPTADAATLGASDGGVAGEICLSLAEFEHAPESVLN